MAPFASGCEPSSSIKHWRSCGGQRIDRRGGRRPRIDQEFARLEDPHQDLPLLTQEEYNAHLKRKIVAKLQADLPEENMQAFLRLIEKEITPQQAADELGITLNAVNLRKFHIVRKLREYFESLGEFLD